MSTALDRHRYINHYERREADVDFDINFLAQIVFCCSSHTFLTRIPSSHVRDRCGTSSRSSPKMYAEMTRLPSFSFPVFYPALSLTSSTFEVFSVNQWPSADSSWYIWIFNLVVCCYHDLDFGNKLFTFLFFFPLSSCLSLFLYYSLSLSLTVLNLFLKYRPIFSAFSDWPLSLGNNLLLKQSKKIPIYKPERQRFTLIKTDGYSIECF